MESTSKHMKSHPKNPLYFGNLHKYIYLWKKNNRIWGTISQTSVISISYENYVCQNLLLCLLNFWVVWVFSSTARHEQSGRQVYLAVKPHLNSYYFPTPHFHSWLQEPVPLCLCLNWCLHKLVVNQFSKMTLTKTDHPFVKNITCSKLISLVAWKR